MIGPVLRVIEQNYVIWKDKKFLFFGGTDYHRISNNPLIIKALTEAALQYGISAGGSRTTTGNHPLHLQLEERIAEFFETEASVVFASGYLSNTILLQALGQEYNLFFIDENAHSSLNCAARQINEKVLHYKHIDAQNLEDQLKKHVNAGKRPLIISDGVFPMQGEMPPLIQYADVAKRFGAKILIDDAHAMAVLGETGKGSWEDASIDRDIIYQTGTMSKGFGIFGGVIPTSREIVDKIHKKSQAFIGSTGLALPLVAAAIQSVSYIQSNLELVRGLQKRSLKIKEKFRRLGFDIPRSPVPIISITYRDKEKNKRLFQMLMKKKIFPSFIDYPGSPPGGHFRFAVSSNHTEEQVNLLYEAIRSSL